ncbi:PHP domain-containing protein [Methanolobus halotolerans]|uniref:PHP domain-containing protein n=1 Tax=Methanolobus halotolerans TaxID=2052935 RepID=A0A4E0PVP9_9EURY|nr:PHP domain-containing protein [Methanolobus halotolerans]
MFRRKDINKQRIISSERAAELLENGWHRADLHVHTCCSYDVPPARSMHPENLLLKGKSRGMDYITFTDHDTVKAYDLLGWKTKNLVTGVEVSIKDLENVGHTIHVNVFGFDKQQYSEFDRLVKKESNIYSLIDYLKSNDLPYMYNHPFWFKLSDKPNIPIIPELARHFPVIEYNIQDLKQKNIFSMLLAKYYGKGMAVTTDSHTGGIGKAYTIAEGEDFHEYYNNIRKGRSYMIMDDPSWKHLTREMNAWIELVFSMEKEIREEMGFTSGVGKIDRLVDIFDRYGLSHHQKINGAMMNVMKLISRSGLPVFMYMLSKQPQVSRIGKTVNVLSGIT